MGAFISKQPNGKYCRFSTVVDTITNYNMTEEEYIELCKERAAQEAEKEAKRTLKHFTMDFSMVKESFFPNNMSVEEFNEILKEIGDTEPLKKEDYSEDE